MKKEEYFIYFKRGTMKKALFILTFLSLPLFLNSLFADHAPVGSAYQSGTVSPMNNENIRLVSEIIFIHAVGNYFKIRVEYVFRNQTKFPQTVSMGFPSIEEIPLFYPIEEFVFYEGKTPLNVMKINAEYNESDNGQDKELKDNKIKKMLLCSTVHFKPDESKHMRTEYKQSYANTSAFDSRYSPYFEYILKTGRFWKEDIEKIEVFITGLSHLSSLPKMLTQYYLEPKYANQSMMSDLKSIEMKSIEYSSGLSIFPENYRIIDDGKTIYMLFRNIEPDFNILLKPLSTFFMEKSAANYGLEWHILSDNDDKTFYELPKGKLVSLNLNNSGPVDYRESNYWAGAYLIDNLEIGIKGSYTIDRIYLWTTGFFNKAVTKREEYAIEFDKIKVINNKIIIPLAHPILSTDIAILPVYKEMKPFMITEIKYVPSTIKDSFRNGGIINSSGIGLYEDNHLDAEKIRTFDKFEIVEVIAISNYREMIDDRFEYWYKVKTKNNNTGWVYGYYLDRNVQGRMHYKKILQEKEFLDLIEKQ